MLFDVVGTASRTAASYVGRMSSTVRTRLQELTAPASGDVTMPVDFSRRRLTISRPAVVVIVLAALLVMGAAGIAGSKVTQPEAAVVPEPSVAAITDDGARNPIESAANGPASSSADSSVASSVVVSVVGLVKKPGVVTLPAGSRVADAIDAAGGFSAQANPASVNLARLLADGEQIVVTDQVDPAANSGGGGPSHSAGGANGTPGSPKASGTESAPGAKVNVNTASETELETLPGIGPATAAAIIAFRQDNGPFTSVAQLGEVPGIGPKKLERISGSVTV